LTVRQRAWADSISLNAIATPAAREPGALVTRCRSLTVAKVDRVGGAQMDPMLGWVVVERQQFVEIIGDLGDRLGPLGAVVGGECVRGGCGGLAVLGVSDLRDRGLRTRLGSVGGARRRGRRG